LNGAVFDGLILIFDVNFMITSLIWGDYIIIGSFAIRFGINLCIDGRSFDFNSKEILGFRLALILPNCEMA